MKLKEFVDQYGNYEIKNVGKLKDLLVDKNKKWKPNKGQNYYYVNTNGSVYISCWENSYIDNYRYNFMIIFKTEQECERYLEIQLACQEASFEPDWEDTFQYKYCFCYQHENNTIRIDFFTYTNYNSQFYFESKEIAQSLIDRFGEKDIAKYVLGVG